MKISYAITVCNEHKEVEKLLTFLFEHKRNQDQVVVQMDKDNVTKEVIDICERFESKQASEYNLVQYSLDKNFAAYKNNLNKSCAGNWIFQIDADEIPNEYLIEALPFILEANEDKEEIYWIKPVHEQLKGYTKFANLPAEEKFALYHPKNIGRQEQQNKFYETI